MDRIKGRETKVLRRLFRKKKIEDESVQGFCMRTAKPVRSIWNKMKLPLLNEIIAESICCCADDREARVRSEEYDMVEEHESN